MEQTIFEYDGAKFLIDFEFEAGDPETYEYPGWPPELIIHSIKFENVEMIDMLKESVINYIEHKLILAMIEV